MIEFRLGTNFSDEEVSRQYAEAMARHAGSCDAVWFTTEYGFPLPEVHREKAASAARAAEAFRKRGITVSLQMANTVGHGEYMKSENNGAIGRMKLEHLVGAGGERAGYAFCWNGENLRRYTAETAAIYARALQPDTFWIDDDLRPSNHAPVEIGCFCPACMRAFNRKYSSDFTREELVRAVNCGEEEWRERWIAFTREGLASLASIIADAVQAVSPGTRMALQYGLLHNAAGSDEAHLFRALRRAGRPPASRAGEGTYHDKYPFALLEKQIALSYGNARLPDYVRYRVPEIENTPYVAFGKSHYGTLLEGTLALAYGHTGLSIAAFMLPYEELSFHEDLLKGVSRIRAYWEHLAACNENTYAGCAGIVASGWRRAKDPACRFGYGKIDALHGTSLTRLGLAESFETLHAPFLVLKGETVDTLTDEEILPLFSRPVLTDAAALEKLQERGFGRYLPVRAYPTDGRAYAELLPNGKRWQESFFSVGEAGTYRLEGECEPLGELCTSSSESIGISAAVFSAGRARWAAFGYSLWDDLLSSAKRDQIVFAADRICGGLPAYVPSARQVTCIPRVTAEGKTAAVTVVNIGISPVQGLELIVNNPVGGHFVYEREGERCELTPVFSGGRVHLTLPDFVRGWDAATVFIL